MEAGGRGRDAGRRARLCQVHQLDAGTLVRDYFALCHGILSPRREELSARVRYSGAEGMRSEVSGHGKPARTTWRLLVRMSGENKALSFASVRIGTGRRHQIRVHFAHMGHALVTDFLYASYSVARGDGDWCPRNFLHRHSLGFRDGRGAPTSVELPLPPDLAGALACLSGL